jgi:hypothetical protein
MNKVHDTPSDVDSEEGEVIVEGPDGVAVSFTPDAAVETSDRLLNGGMKANGQLVQTEREAERRSRPDTARPFGN